MDCTPFIRTKWVLAAWLLAPLLILIAVELAVRSFYNQQQSACEQNKTLAHVAPRMQEEVDIAEHFLKNYRVKNLGQGSVEDAYIATINTAASEAGFTTETVHLNQETLDDDLGTSKIVMRLQGTGTCRQIADFLQKVKQADPLICESKLAMAPSGRSATSLQINVELTKIYVK